MKKSIYLFIGLITVLSSCSDDDDSGANSGSTDITGNWVVESFTDPDVDPNKNVCEGNKTMLKFGESGVINIESIVVQCEPDNSDCNADNLKCADGTGFLNKNDKDEEIIEFESFPPPKDQFTFALANDKLRLVGSNGEGAGLEYIFIKVN